MKTLGSAVMIITAVTLFGCSSPPFGIRVIDTVAKEVHLTFAKGVPVNIGDLFSLYHFRPPPANIGGHTGHRGGPLNLKHEIGRVQVVAIVGETQAVVRSFRAMWKTVWRWKNRNNNFVG